MNVTWEDVAQQMADDTGKDAEAPSIRDAIDALRKTKLQPAFVLQTWQERVGA